MGVFAGGVPNLYAMYSISAHVDSPNNPGGIDSGDATWRWFYGQRDSTAETSKDLTVRFGADGVVKSYSFTSSFPDDLRRLDDPKRVK